MYTFQEWAFHYNYDSTSPEARSDYQRYCDEYALLRSLVGCSRVRSVAGGES